jgi:hypothetical protein
MAKEYVAFLRADDELPAEMRAAIHATWQEVDKIVADFRSVAKESATVEWAVSRLAATLFDQDVDHGGLVSWLATAVWQLAVARDMVESQRLANGDGEDEQPVPGVMPVGPLLELAAQWEREAPEVDPHTADGQEIFGDHALELRTTIKDATPQARPGTEQQWCVWYGGPDPDNAAGVEIYGDEAEAREAFEWYRSDLGSGVAVRDVTISPWRVVGSAPATEAIEQASEHVPMQIGTHDAEGRRTFAPPGDVCAGCSDPGVGRWVPVSQCPDALSEWERQQAELLATLGIEADVVAMSCDEQVSHGGACDEPLIDGICPEHGQVRGRS